MGSLVEVPFIHAGNLPVQRWKEPGIAVTTSQLNFIRELYALFHVIQLTLKFRVR
jgi:hypothetical protein